MIGASSPTSTRLTRRTSSSVFLRLVAIKSRHIFIEYIEFYWYINWQAKSEEYILSEPPTVCTVSPHCVDTVLHFHQGPKCWLFLDLYEGEGSVSMSCTGVIHRATNVCNSYTAHWANRTIRTVWTVATSSRSQTSSTLGFNPSLCHNCDNRADGLQMLRWFCTSFQGLTWFTTLSSPKTRIAQALSCRVVWWFY